MLILNPFKVCILQKVGFLFQIGMLTRNFDNIESGSELRKTMPLKPKNV